MNTNHYKFMTLNLYFRRLHVNVSWPLNHYCRIESSITLQVFLSEQFSWLLIALPQNSFCIVGCSENRSTDRAFLFRLCSNHNDGATLFTSSVCCGLYREDVAVLLGKFLRRFYKMIRLTVLTGLTGYWENRNVTNDNANCWFISTGNTLQVVRKGMIIF